MNFIHMKHRSSTK